MVKKYRIFFHGINGEEETFRVRMAHLGAPPEIVDKMLSDAPIILKTGLSLENSRRYAEALQDAGGRVTIEENGYFEKSRRVVHSVPVAPFEDFTMCPECGFKQPKGLICIKCGFRL